MIENQAYLFLVFTLIGIIIGLLFDFFRILRRSFKTTDLITYIQDILFWILTGIIILYSIFIFNNGEIRLYMFLGILIGIILYILLFSNYVIKINVYILNYLKKFISKIIKIISYPYILLLKILYKIINQSKKLFKKAQNLTKTNNTLEKN